MAHCHIAEHMQSGMMFSFTVAGTPDRPSCPLWTLGVTMPTEQGLHEQPTGATDGSLDVVVIGGSQAGLAMAWHVKGLGLRFIVLDAAPEIGQTWRSRWDSLKLFPPAQYDALPGLAF